MSLIPLMFGNWWDDDICYDHPMRILDQHYHPGMRCARQSPSTSLFVIKPRNSEEAKMQADITAMPEKDKFQVAVDVQQFKPKEISVRTQDNNVIVEAKHEEKPDEHGYVYRHFVRRYVLPEGVKSTDVKTNLSSDGVLTISAPKHAAKPPSNERVVPIQQTGPVRQQLKNSTGDTKEGQNEKAK